MNSIIWSSMARAKMHYPTISVCGFIFMLNHFHMLLVVEDPEQVSSFVGYIKQEMAHAVNRLLGRRQKTIWKSEYDSPRILDSVKALEILTYIYMNPVQAGLVESIMDYPGVSSWEILNKNQRKCWRPYFTRDNIQQLINPAQPKYEDEKALAKLLESSKMSCLLEYSPFAWKKCFEDTKDTPDEELKAALLLKIKEAEADLVRERIKNNQTVAGRDSLLSSSMIRQYNPKKHGRKTICLASDKKLRIEFITFFKDLCRKARYVYNCWKNFDFSLSYPLGLFAPAFPRVANRLHSQAFLDDDLGGKLIFC